MQKREIQIKATEFETLEELPEQDRQLIISARQASGKAYAPYSGFLVGAAVLLNNGDIIKGNNQENADFTDGLCAERVALFYAQASYPDLPVVALAVSAVNTKGVLTALAQPCGSCRQVMVETESRFKQPIRIILDGKDKIMVFESAECLLPLAFKPTVLNK
ncbi:MAG: cytidine deaminase [Draconibacterium sp.]|nr:MAG: cytidine deaminase [Draconibacterium sp.]